MPYSVATYSMCMHYTYTDKDCQAMLLLVAEAAPQLAGLPSFCEYTTDSNS